MPTTAPRTQTPAEVEADRNDLLQRLEEAQERIDTERLLAEQFREERDAWRSRKVPDKEAECIAECVRALSVLVDGGAPREPQIVRVLAFLAARFGVTWSPPAEEPKTTTVMVPYGAREGDTIMIDLTTKDAWRA